MYYYIFVVLEQLNSHNTAQKLKFSIKDFFSKCDQIRRKPQKTANLVTFTEAIVNGKLDFLCSVNETKNIVHVHSVD